MAQWKNMSAWGRIGLVCDWLSIAVLVMSGLRVKMCVWLGVSRGVDLAFLNAD